MVPIAMGSAKKHCIFSCVFFFNFPGTGGGVRCSRYGEDVEEFCRVGLGAGCGDYFLQSMSRVFKKEEGYFSSRLQRNTGYSDPCPISQGRPVTGEVGQDVGQLWFVSISAVCH